MFGFTVGSDYPTAVVRAQAADLEYKRAQERKVPGGGAWRSFSTLDPNKDGTVDVVELKAGLEDPLRRSFLKQLMHIPHRTQARQNASQGVSWRKYTKRMSLSV